ncbi:MAG: carbohydrate ABC transporter permease [Candidatus Margulisbacteria bacterium]|nr:carbohydrate ABC transporter permease [Candidatus Margulisiibacteriota bacterium]
MNLSYYAKKRITDIIISIIMLALLAITLLPIGWMVFSSLKSSTDIAIGRVGLSHNVEGKVDIRWQNYVDMWKNVNFGLYLRNSLVICGFTMFFAMVFATFAAYALSRFKFPGADLFSNATLATQMIPMIMYLIPIYIMFVKFTMMTGIPVKGTFPGIILIYSAWFLPFSIWILRGFFAAIPKELEEAALIDGCSRLRVFWHIALPLAMPGIIATGIYVFLNAWDELMFAWVLTSADTMTIPVGIRLFVGNYQNRFDLMMAAATVATIPVVVLFFLLQRHIVRGLTAGAVKG